jgi:hypothetical protein
VIDRLLEFAPPVISATATVSNRCIYATALGIDTLARFDVPAAPCPVHVQAWNPAAWRLTCQENFERFDWQQAQAFTISTTGGDLLTDIPGRVYFGHLVAVVAGRYLLDLDLGAMARPHRQLILPPSGAFVWPPGKTLMRYETHGGGRLEYQIRDDSDEWKQSPDWWNRRRLAPIVDRLAKAIRKGRL